MKHCLFIFLLLFVTLIQLPVKKAYAWQHFMSPEKTITQEVLKDREIKYCVEGEKIQEKTSPGMFGIISDHSLSSEWIDFYVVHGIRAWLNNSIVEKCGVYDERGTLLNLKDIK
ncbi:MAG: hypothetical protein WCQ53_05805, partial [bacterium]